MEGGPFHYLYWPSDAIFTSNLKVEIISIIYNSWSFFYTQNMFEIFLKHSLRYLWNNNFHSIEQYANMYRKNTDTCWIRSIKHRNFKVYTESRNYVSNFALYMFITKFKTGNKTCFQDKHVYAPSGCISSLLCQGNRALTKF